MKPRKMKLQRIAGSIWRILTGIFSQTRLYPAASVSLSNPVAVVNAKRVFLVISQQAFF
jgi:hypothetical protein